MSSHTIYREPFRPVVKPETILIVRRELALSITGMGQYTVVNGFKGPDARVKASKWLGDFLRTLPKSYSATYMVWTLEEYETHTGRKWVWLTF